MKIIMIAVLMALISKEGRPYAGIEIHKLPVALQQVLNELPRNIVIAHRGTTYWAPEETEAAMRWARDVGADYLEFDLQRTRDGVLIALHDVNLRRTTDIAEVFPERADAPVSAFTLDELRQLDAGSWFNETYPDRAKKEFVGQDILTLEDVIRIAEGYRIVRDEQGRRIYEWGTDGKKYTRYEKDPQDSGNRPGIYPETKEPHLFPGMEQDLREELERLGWYHIQPGKMKKIEVPQGGVGIANTIARVILQTFSAHSLVELEKAFPRRIPTCFLLWLGNEPSDLKENTPKAYAAKINYAVAHGAVIIGPSIAGSPNDYADLLAPWQGEMIYRAGLAIHPYSFDTEEQMAEYTGWKNRCPQEGRVDGMFTNKADMTIQFYQQTLMSAYFKSNAALGIPDNIQRNKALFHGYRDMSE